MLSPPSFGVEIEIAVRLVTKGDRTAYATFGGSGSVVSASWTIPVASGTTIVQRSFMPTADGHLTACEALHDWLINLYCSIRIGVLETFFPAYHRSRWRWNRTRAGWRRVVRRSIEPWYRTSFLSYQLHQVHRITHQRYADDRINLGIPRYFP